MWCHQRLFCNFSDDVKLYLDISCNNSSLIPHEAIIALHSWTIEWQLEISYNKCQVLHLGAQHQHADYHLRSFVLSTISCAKDLGFLVDAKLKIKSLFKTPLVRASRDLHWFCVALPLVIPSHHLKHLVHNLRPILQYESSILAPVY